MEKTVTMKDLNWGIEQCCNLGRTQYNWTDDMCLQFAADLMERLARDGWRIVEG